MCDSVQFYASSFVCCPVFELMETRVCRAPAPHLFLLLHRANAVAENLGTEGPHTYFSVIRLLLLSAVSVCLVSVLNCSTTNCECHRVLACGKDSPVTTQTIAKYACMSHSITLKKAALSTQWSNQSWAPSENFQREGQSVPPSPYTNPSTLWIFSNSVCFPVFVFFFRGTSLPVGARAFIVYACSLQNTL